jgi:hypothetical protein
MARRYSERFLDRYVKHPAASSANPLSDGWFVDSGTKMIAQNNAAHLARESLRHLVFSLGPGQATQFATANAMFTGLDDAPQLLSPIGDSLQHMQIPWDRRTAARFGPFAAIQDYALADGRMTQRKIRAQADFSLDAATTSERLYVAATSRADDDPRDITKLLAFGYVDVAGSGYQRSTPIDLTFNAPLPTSTEFVCRADGTDNPTNVAAAPFYLWFGWRLIGATTNYVCGFSAWEID